MSGRKLHICSLLLVVCATVALFHSPAASQDLSRVVTARVPAPSLAGNLLGDSASQSIEIYLPPSYATSGLRYPVVYFLTGFGDDASSVAGGAYGFSLPATVDSMITEDSVHEMIFVVVSGRNSLGGSFYANSPIVGDWEQFVSGDLVGYLDSHYRTIPDASSRGLAGHSMGGGGAFNIAMHRPGVFGALYLMSAPITDSCGMKKSPMLESEGLIDSIVQIQETLRILSRSEARSRLRSLLKSADWRVALTFSYGAAYAPDTSGQYPFIAYPYHRENGLIVADSVLLRRWECGFGAIPMKLWRYRDNLLALRRIGLECGLNDEFTWIREGCGYLSIQLDVQEIPHQTSFFRGGHQDKLGRRMREAMLPFFSDALSFQS